MHPSERNRGYFQALFGMLLTRRGNNDRYAFLSNVDLTDIKKLKRFKHEFLSHVDSRLHAEYDRGYFEAWAEYMKVLPKLEVSVTSAANNTIVKKEEMETQSEAEPQEAKAETEAATIKAASALEVEQRNRQEQQSIQPQRTLTEFAK